MQKRMCRLLLDNGADVNARNVSARTALQEAAMSVRYSGINPRATMELLIERGAHVNAYGHTKWTALTECAVYGRGDLAELLLAHGAHLDANPGPDDPTSGSNPDLGSRYYKTPLIACCDRSWNEELICLLLDKVADIRSKNKNGKTIIQLASNAKSVVVLDALARVKRSQRRTKGQRL